VPVRCEGVPDEILDPKETWKDPKAYDEKAKELARRFKENFKKFEDQADDVIRFCVPDA